MNPYGNTKHGHHGSLTYSRWKSMRQRAAMKHGPYATVECCARWASFEEFLADMGECPESLTLDRIDNQRGYEPGNCRWATMADQNANRSSVVMLTHNGNTKSLTEWATAIGIPANSLRTRLYLGWSSERALTQPLKRRTVR